MIADYDKEAATSRYKDLVIYTTPDLVASLTAAGYKPANGQFVDMTTAPELKTMPEGGATYYAVWEPFESDYVVQLWFEDADTENLYNVSHTYDIVRTADISSEVKHNAFDVDRADESSIIAAANASAKNDGSFDAISFEDPDSKDPVKDTYVSYPNGYMHSPFYGFDFLKCETCMDENGVCKDQYMKDGHCTCPDCAKMSLGVDPLTGADTTGNRCNCEKVTVSGNGKTVLNVFYTREQWKIIYHPTVELTAYKDYATQDETPLHEGGTLKLLGQTSATTYVFATYPTIIGRYAWHILDDIANEDASLPQTYTYTGKFGMPVSEGYQAGSTQKLGEADPEHSYTGRDFSGWKEIVKDLVKANQTGGNPQIGDFNNNYRYKFYETSDLITDDLYFTTEQHNFDHYLNNWGYGIGIPEKNLPISFFPVDLEFSGVSEIDPSVFYTYTNQGNDAAPDGSVPTKVTMQRYTSTWQGERFSNELCWDLATGTYQWGTHTMNLYPFYGNVSNEYTIEFWGEALPSEDDMNCLTDTSTMTRYTQIQEDTVTSPDDTLFYNAITPAGFTPKMWRTSVHLGDMRFPPYYNSKFTALPTTEAEKATKNANFTGQKVTNVGVQANYTIPSGAISLYASPNNPGVYNRKYNDAGYGFAYKPAFSSSSTYKTSSPDLNNITELSKLVYGNNSYRALLPVWELPGVTWDLYMKDYWITDWIQLIDDPNADMVYNVTPAMKARLESSVMIGALYPTNSRNTWFAQSSSNNVYFGYPWEASYDGQKNPINGLTTAHFMQATNAIAYTRNKYSITYNTAFTDKNGNHLTDMTGKILVDAIYQTPSIYFDDSILQYQKAYFCYDPAKADKFTFLGYYDTEPAVPAGYSKYATVIGGEWYLDADGTSPFDENSFTTMPAKDFDVYFMFNELRYNVVFIDEMTIEDTDENTLTLTMNGEEQTFHHVREYQSVLPNGHATRPDPDPKHKDYYFVGWFLDKAGSVPFSFEQEINADTVVYAVWKPKVPTTYDIVHIVRYPDGSTKELIPETQKQLTGYVGETIDANALGTDYYEDGMYFVPDDYSKTMVLLPNDPSKPNEQKNVLTFVYEYTGRQYTVRYHAMVDGKEVEVSPDVVVPTTLDQVTVKARDFYEWGWERQTDPDAPDYDPDYKTASFDKTGSSPDVTYDENGNPIITFWYKRRPGPTYTVAAHKYLDGKLAILDELPKGKTFSFTLSCDDPTFFPARVVQSDEEARILFGSINFYKEGTFVFTISENDEGGLFEYDETYYQFTATVTRDAKTNLVLEVSDMLHLVKEKDEIVEVEEDNDDLEDEVVDGPIFKNKTIILPETGDNTPIVQLIVLLGAAMALIVVLMVRENKKKHAGGAA